MGEYKNYVIGTVCFLIIGGVTLFVLRILASEMSAGSAGFELCVPFLLAQEVIIIGFYWLWYRKVNRLAADMMDIANMRKMALGNIARYFIPALLITLVISVAAVVVMIFDLLSIGIPAEYCYSAVLTMFLIGNICHFVLMRVALPNRVTGSC